MKSRVAYGMGCSSELRDNNSARKLGNSEPTPGLRPTWARGMWRDIEMQHASAIMTDDEEAVEDAKRQRWYRKEVHSGDDFPMIAQKGEPAFGGPGIPECSPHPTGDGSFGDMETEHQQLPVNTRCAPCRVLRHHAKDRIANLFSKFSSSPTSIQPQRLGARAAV